MRREILALVLLASAACGGTSQFVATAPTTRDTFAASLAQASEEALAGRYAVADRVLADFAVKNPASAEAVDAIYWRAIYQLDPANTGGSAREAASLLESYITAPGSTRRAEAATLRRLALAVEHKPTASVASSQPRTDPVAEKAKDDEILRLKDELAKANAELERIKRRLAKP